MRFLFPFKILLCAFAAVAVMMLTSCGDSDKGGDAPDVTCHRTVLVYMVADNSLGKIGCDQMDLDEMVQGAQAGGLNGGRLLVYYNRRGTEGGLAPQLLEITAKGITVLKTYADDPTIYSTDVARMREAIDDSRRFAPAQDYGLILWSHGTGWTEGSQSRSVAVAELTVEQGEEVSAPVAYDFGEDRGVTMKVSSLHKALKGYGFSFLYFDCCFMGTVEVMYELRDVAPVIVASGIELPVNGMPYDKNLPVFFTKGNPDLTAAARNTFNFYDVQSGQDRTCGIAVINTAALPALADASRAIFATVTEHPASYRELQKFTRPGWGATIYDFEQYMEMICKDETLLRNWRKALGDAIAYEAHTPMIFMEVMLDRHCGLGSFIIMDESDKKYRNYNLQSWYTDVVSASPLLKL